MSNYFVLLPHRGLLRITGSDRRSFLQGLISNNVHLLDSQPCVYACLLNAQGRYLHDFFITENSDMILLDCEGGERAQDLFKKLSMYKLRAHVELSVEPHIDIYALSGLEMGTPDPRHAEMGYRSFEKPDIEEKPFAVWDQKRILLAMPDGSRDMIVGQSTLLESNIDRVNGISWDKGCYIGQELTARMHYRGLVKKRLQLIQGKNLPAFGAEIRRDGVLIGDMRSQCGDVGLALLKIL